MKRILILLMTGLTLACSKKAEEVERLPPQQEGMRVTYNNQNKALLNITITLKNLTYDDVQVMCSHESYKERNFNVNFVRRMEKHEVISQEGKIVLDVTDLLEGVRWVLDQDNQMYVLLMTKESEKTLDEYNEIKVKIKKGETYHIHLTGEKK